MSLGGDVLDELRWTVRGRRDWLGGIGINLALGLAYAIYVAYDPNDHFFIKSAAGVSANVAMFVLSDPITTNQLGADRERVIEGLRRGNNVVRMLFAKNISLTIILLPLTMAIAAGLRLLLDEDRTILSSVVLDIWIVIGWLALGNIASVLTPYWPMPLKQRWRLRNTWLWWALVMAVPYALYYLRAWVLEPTIDDQLGRHAYRRASVNWEWGVRYVGVAFLMLAVSYLVCWLVGRKQKWLIGNLSKDR